MTRGRKLNKRMARRPLKAFVSQGVLVIEIGVDTLAHAMLHGGYADALIGDPQKAGKDRFRIEDAREFARDVTRAMLDEAEDGSSLLTRFVDDACVSAVEDGSLAFIDMQESQS